MDGSWGFQIWPAASSSSNITNSTCFSSLAFILSPQVYCTSGIKGMGDTPQGHVPTERIFSPLESQAMLTLGCLQSPST